MSGGKKLSITAIVLTHNEEANINRCLRTLIWAERIILVDSGSTDKTLTYATSYGCDIYYNPWLGFSAQRNWAMDNTSISTEWIIFIDADEEVTSALQIEIREVLASSTKNAYYLCFKVVMFGKWIKRSSNFPVWHPRIVRFGKARFRDGVTGHGETWDVEGEIGFIKEPYVHYSFSKGFDFWFEKHNRLSAMECASQSQIKETSISVFGNLFSRDQHKRRQALRIISYRIPFRPFFRFIYQMILRGGVLDGPAGWTYCSLYLAYEIMISAKMKEERHLSQSMPGEK